MEIPQLKSGHIDDMIAYLDEIQDCPHPFTNVEKSDYEGIWYCRRCINHIDREGNDATKIVRSMNEAVL